MSMPFSGISAASMEQLITTDLPESLGLADNASLSTMVTTMYDLTEGAQTGPEACAPSFTGGTVTVTAGDAGPELTVTVPADQMPVESGDSGILSALAGMVAGRGLRYMGCHVRHVRGRLDRVRNRGGSLSGDQKGWCAAVRGMAAGNRGKCHQPGLVQGRAYRS